MRSDVKRTQGSAIDGAPRAEPIGARPSVDLPAEQVRHFVATRRCEAKPRIDVAEGPRTCAVVETMRDAVARRTVVRVVAVRARRYGPQPDSSLGGREKGRESFLLPAECQQIPLKSHGGSRERDEPIPAEMDNVDPPCMPS